jgi:cysteine synthase B
MIVEKITDLIGNTPLLKISGEVTGLKNIDLYAKLEMMNPFGSIKDRTVWGMVKDDVDRISKNDMTIYENSSGNTAKTLAILAGIYGVKFRLVSSFKKVQEQKDILKVLGTDIEEIATASNCFDPSDPNDPQYLIERAMAKDPEKIYFPSQFTNEKNPDYHQQTTAQEIYDDLGAIDYFIGGLGTTGSTLGVARKMLAHNKDFKVIGVVSPRNQFIPGIRSLDQMMESSLFDKSTYEKFVPVNEIDAVHGMLELSRQSGVLAGACSGANYKAAIEYLREIDGTLDRKCKAVFMVSDRMEWYISYIKERMPELFGHKEQDLALHGFDSTNIQTVATVNAADIEAWRTENTGALVVDTRVPQSFDLLHIPHSINMPQDIFEKWVVSDNPISKETPVLLVCAVGEQSRHFAAYLSQRGYKAYNLEGGIMAWRDQEYLVAA